MDLSGLKTRYEKRVRIPHMNPGEWLLSRQAAGASRMVADVMS